MSNEDDIVVVQGSSVPAASSGGGDGGGGHGRGEKQETRCRDPIFAVLFYAMLISITAVAIIFGPDAFNTDENADGNDEKKVDDTTDYSGYVKVAVIVFFASLVTAPILLQIIMRFAKTVIKAGLIFNLVVLFFMAIGALAVNVIVGILSFLSFAFMACYVYFAWPRIPFASANLNTASTAVKRNWGVIVYAFFFVIASGFFNVVWTIAAFGIIQETQTCDDEKCKDPSFAAIFFLLLAFYFGVQVFQNTIHVVIAGAVGTWWFSPQDASSCCSAAVNDSVLRATTTSFGSICFGSLLVAILQTLEQIARNARNDDGNFLACIAECILSCLADMLEYFNKWAYIYVGLYGYSYIEAGKNVFQLFKSRGWESIIADSLVDYGIFFVALIGGLGMGLVGFVLGSTTSLLNDTSLFNDAVKPELIGFVIGLLIGYVVFAIMMNVISSGVNAVIVLFAEAPAEFAENYPVLYQEMVSAWGLVYPDVNVGRF